MPSCAYLYIQVILFPLPDKVKDAGCDEASTMNDWDTVWQDVNLATMAANGTPYGQIKDAALAIKDGRIAWFGKRTDLPSNRKAIVHSGDNAWVTPGLIDCHTHLIYGGDRIDEFELRLNGASYEEIAQAGGGILSTVRHTRESSPDTLYALAHKRLQQFIDEGVTTVEIKSGYGLNTETEICMLETARALDERQPIDIVPTFLGAHALPPEYRNNRGAYIDLICREMIPQIAAENLAVAVDAFCEGIAFSPSEVSQVFTAACAHGLKVKLHADQLSDTGGGKLAAQFNALSADHIEYLSSTSAQAMATAGTVAVLLPGAFYALRETQLPPVNLLRQHSIPIAIASDSNPGTSPAYSLRLMINMACVLFQLTPEEALAGVTREAARALGLTDRGVIAQGKIADLAFWDIEKPAQLAFEIGGNRCIRVLKNGATIN
jgi:imidazolonepropionase